MGELARLRKATAAALCLECGKCSTLCPLASFGGFSAARMMSIQDPETEIQGHSEAVQRCLTCASCELRCPQGVRYTEFVRGLREEIPLQSRRPRPHGEVFQMAAKVERGRGNGRPPSWLEADLRIAEEGEVGLFVGCLPLFDVVFGEELDVEMVEIARSAVRLLNRLGIEPVVIADESCCGHDLLWSGEHQAFALMAQRNTELFQARGVKRLITTCAECCRTWRVDYPDVVTDIRPQVEHLAEFLASELNGEKVVFREGESGVVTFQDPCRLGRHLGIVDAPRQLLNAIPGTEIVEMYRAGRDALCCGTAGFIHCDSVSRQLQSQRLESAAATGARTLLTACPKCQLHFRCAQTEDRNRGRESPDLAIEDLTVFVAGRLEESAGKTPQTGDKP